MTCDLRIKYDEVLKGRAAELFADGHGHTSVARLSPIVHGDESLLPCGLPDGLRATGDGRRHGGRKVCVPGLAHPPPCSKSVVPQWRQFLRAVANV